MSKVGGDLIGEQPVRPTPQWPGPLSTEERAPFHTEIYQWLQSVSAQVRAYYLKNKDMQTSLRLKLEAVRWVEVRAVFDL